MEECEKHFGLRPLAKKLVRRAGIGDLGLLIIEMILLE